MIGVINYEKLEKDFLNKVYQIAEQGLNKSVKNLEDEKEKLVEYLEDSWSVCLRRLENKYQKLQASKVTGELCYGYLSFLRSGILNKSDWYRMDYYDARDNISEIECGEKLDATLILNMFNHYTDEIRDEFASQTLVREYVADKIIYQMAEQFCSYLEPLLLEAFYRVLAEEGASLYHTLNVKFFVGEFFAQTKQVSVWKDSANHILKLRA